MEFVTPHARGGGPNVKGDGGSDGSGSATHGSAVNGAAKRRKVDVSSRRIVHESAEASVDSACVVQCGRCEVAEAEVNSVAARGEDERCVSVDGEDPGSTSCCSSNQSTEEAEKTSGYVDLEGKRGEVDATATRGRQLLLDSSSGRGRQPQDESADPDDNNPPNPPAATNPHGRQSRERMPTKREIDDFFSAAETSAALRFKEKYNFDFDKGEPLEGRYEWRPLIPGPAKEKGIIKARFLFNY
ncbi:hypothetical protein MLD38_031457 [Melastoma candidum]|uniref:Uncharacterized protein n=1 Tax=Melastoma candidum TaxID=119954 RepID=A0ACB9MP50_9MYRT|nr:hypothetical protein MLD38_031457 [Melastoma candidum]